MITTADAGTARGHAADTNGHAQGGNRMVRVRVLRQDVTGGESYWERFEVPYEPNMNVISVLQKIAAQARSQDGRRVAPVAWDCSTASRRCAGPAPCSSTAACGWRARPSSTGWWPTTATRSNSARCRSSP